MLKILLISILGEFVREIEEIIWIGIKVKTSTGIKLCVGLLPCLSVNSKCFIVNFIRALNEGINVLRDKYSNDELSISGDFYL
jgi:hypothetical protein